MSDNRCNVCGSLIDPPSESREPLPLHKAKAETWDDLYEEISYLRTLLSECKPYLPYFALPLRLTPYSPEELENSRRIIAKIESLED